MDRLAPEASADGEALVMRVGRTFGKGVVAAVTSTLPAALRMGDGASIGGALAGWIVLCALATPLAIVAVFVIKRARVGLQMIAGDRASLFVLGVVWWSVTELGLLSLFGALLRKTTHQHALAGVTFAAFAAVTGALVGLFAKRTMSLLARSGAGVQKTALVVAGGAAFVILMLVGLRTSRAEGIHTAAALVDVLSLTVATAIASSRMFDRYRPLAIGGVPAAILLVMVGLTTLRFDPKVGEALPETAPLEAAMIDLLH
jgi:hypothetical protein